MPPACGAGARGKYDTHPHPAAACAAADPELFEGPANCQGDTYRRMRDATQHNWAGSYPATNAMWMHYLADTLLTKKLPGS